MSKFNDVLNKKAVALSYDEKKDAAPVIVASGMGYLAKKNGGTCAGMRGSRI